MNQRACYFFVLFFLSNFFYNSFYAHNVPSALYAFLLKKIEHKPSHWKSSEESPSTLPFIYYVPFHLPISATESIIDTRIAQTTFDGAIYYLYADRACSKVSFNHTAATTPVTATIQFFQTPTGEAGIAQRVATVTNFTISTPAGCNTASFNEGTVTLKAGFLYVLWGKDSATGTYTMQTFKNSCIDTTGCNGSYLPFPLVFTTTIAAPTTPLTFDVTADSVSPAHIGIAPFINVLP